MTIFCRECGKEINSDVQFCPSCGTERKPSAKTITTTEDHAEAFPEKTTKIIENPMPATEGKRFLNFIIDIISLYILAYILGAFLGSIGLGDSLQSFITNDSFLFEILLGLVFYVFFESLWQRTPGKYITKTKVVNKDGEKPSLENIVLRSLYRYIPFEPFSFFGSYPTGWHDSLSSTFVVPIEYTPNDVRRMVIAKAAKKQ